MITCQENVGAAQTAFGWQSYYYFSQEVSSRIVVFMYDGYLFMNSIFQVIIINKFVFYYIIE